MLKLENVSKQFISGDATVKAVQNVSLHIKEGEIYGIIGYSGAGKSTLVRCMNLLERPDEGNVILNQVNLMTLKNRDLRKQRKKIGMIFQQFNLFASRTVSENVAFALGKSDDKSRVEDLLKLVGIEDKKDAYPSQLSGGQKQRVAIARALANNPQVLLCDEATSALDPQTTQSILNLLKDLNEKLGLTIVIITHEMAVIKDLCDRVAVMQDGIVVEEDNVEAIFANPKSAITREFTASLQNTETIKNILTSNASTLHINPGEHVLKIGFFGAQTTEPLISDVSMKFGIHASIIYGSVDLIKTTPVGSLIVILKGDRDLQLEAIAYLSDKATVEVLIHA